MHVYIMCMTAAVNLRMYLSLTKRRDMIETIVNRDNDVSLLCVEFWRFLFGISIGKNIFYVNGV